MLPFFNILENFDYKDPHFTGEWPDLPLWMWYPCLLAQFVAAWDKAASPQFKYASAMFTVPLLLSILINRYWMVTLKKPDEQHMRFGTSIAVKIANQHNYSTWKNTYLLELCEALVVFSFDDLSLHR